MKKKVHITKEKTEANRTTKEKEKKKEKMEKKI